MEIYGVLNIPCNDPSQISSHERQDVPRASIHRGTSEGTCSLQPEPKSLMDYSIIVLSLGIQRLWLCDVLGCVCICVCVGGRSPK